MSERQKLVDRYLRAALIGAISTAILILFYAVRPQIPGERPEIMELAGWTLVAIVLIASLIGLTYSFFYMFARRSTDEFTLSMWHTGTTVAFFTGMMWLLVGGMIQTFITKTYPESTLADLLLRFDFVDNWAMLVMLAAFFAGFHFKRIRG